MSDINRRVLLASRPTGLPDASNFNIVEEAIPEPGEGEILTRAIWLSVDPYMRSRMNARKSYAPPVEIGGVMGGGAVARVVKSKAPGIAEGDIVMGDLGWQDYAVRNAKLVRKVDPNLAPISTSLSVLGMPGMTAYCGLVEVCKPKEGDTLFISGAGGAVGSLVGQIGKQLGCRVVGVAGSDAKIQWLLDECGFDAAFNYKEHEDYVAKLKEVAPDGIDCYFDNVGGPITDAAMMCLNPFARIAICGQISYYNATTPPMGPRLLTLLIERQATMQGFVVTQFAEMYGEASKQIAQWLLSGKIKYRENVVEGLTNAPEAFLGLFRGDNIGKQLVKVSEE